jgi:hypothetical protein
MKKSNKPVHKCYSCLLNLGDQCWIYKYPRGQWLKNRDCPAFENEEVYKQFETWKKQPDVKTRKELRRTFFRTRRRPLPDRKRKR